MTRHSGQGVLTPDVLPIVRLGLSCALRRCAPGEPEALWVARLAAGPQTSALVSSVLVIYLGPRGLINRGVAAVRCSGPSLFDQCCDGRYTRDLL
jgi:hypothetical protein